MRDAELVRDLVVAVAAAVRKEDLAGAATDPIQPLCDLLEPLLRGKDSVSARGVIAPDGIVIQRREHIRIHGHKSLAVILVDGKIHHDLDQQSRFIVDRVVAPILEEADICVLHQIFGILMRSAGSRTDPHQAGVPGRQKSIAVSRPMSWLVRPRLRPSLRCVQFHRHRHCLVHAPSVARRESFAGGALFSRDQFHSL